MIALLVELTCVQVVAYESVMGLAKGVEGGWGLFEAAQGRDASSDDANA